MNFERWLLGVWYGDKTGGWWLAPLGWLMRSLIGLRRMLFRRGWLRSTSVAVPVIVVGNITAGGTGKTPLVIWLVNAFSQSGLRVGVLTRGHRGSAGRGKPVKVSAVSDTALAGDEAVVIARRTAANVVVSPERVAGARQLEADGVQVIVCDDGLQHYQLDRKVEIAVIDGARGLGNGRFIPAGPLRESPRRLQTVTAVVINGPAEASRWPGAFAMAVTGERIVALTGGQTRALSELSGQRVHAVAGIGNPDRFFDLLETCRIEIRRHVFTDHANYQADDFAFDEDLPILMTEKDAVKCAGFATDRMWFVPVQAQFAARDAAALRNLVAAATGLTLTVDR